jgi:hypothetical protein
MRRWPRPIRCSTASRAPAMSSPRTESYCADALCRPTTTSGTCAYSCSRSALSMIGATRMSPSTPWSTTEVATRTGGRGRWPGPDEADTSVGQPDALASLGPFGLAGTKTVGRDPRRHGAPLRNTSNAQKSDAHGRAYASGRGGGVTR